MQAAQLRELVGTATAGLGAADREVLELALRHGLAPADIAPVLGISTNHAHARMSRARDQLERSLGALLVVRDGDPRCGQLDRIIAGGDGAFTALRRRGSPDMSMTSQRCAATRQRALLQPRRAARGLRRTAVARVAGHQLVPPHRQPQSVHTGRSAPPVRQRRPGFRRGWRRRPHEWGRRQAGQLAGGW